MFLLLLLSVYRHTQVVLGGQLRPSWGSNLLTLVSPFLFPLLVRLPPVSAVIPLLAEQFAWELQFHPHRQKVNFVLKGLRHGFHLGFSPSQQLKSVKKNKPSAAQHPSVVDQYLAHDVSLGRVAGPFSAPPYPNLHVSSFGLFPKEANQGSGASSWTFPP